MNILEIYKAKQSEIYSRIATHTIRPQETLAMQELNYRIDVLETFKAFLKSAPMALDPKQLGYHYQLVDSYVKFVLTERQFGPKTDETGQKKRATALGSFQKVVQDGRKRFASFHAAKPEQYSETVSRYVNTILPLWMQYRNTYVNI